MTPSGFMPNAAATSLGSVALTRSARRVQRSMRGRDAARVEEVAGIGGVGGCGWAGHRSLTTYEPARADQYQRK